MTNIQTTFCLLSLAISVNNLSSSEPELTSKKRQHEDSQRTQSASSFQEKKDESLEIELKFKLPAQSSEVFKQLLGIPAQQVHMSEVYLFGKDIQPTQKEDGYKKMPQYLRLRKTNKGSFVTLKQRTEQSVTEYETSLKDLAMMNNILQALGYGTTQQDRVHLEKQRTKYNVTFGNDKIEVVFDNFVAPAHMQQMGEFVEAELKSSAPSYQHGMETLKRFLVAHGITHVETYPPYIELAINPDAGDKKEEIDLTAYQEKKAY